MTRRLLALGLLLTAFAAWVLAHEGHAPLPTRGAQVDTAKGLVTLSRDARRALDGITAEVVVRPVRDELLAYATLVTPWQRRAVVGPRVGGRVTKLLARPGQAVAAGEVLAEVEGAELTALQQEVAAARVELGSAEALLTGLREASRAGAASGQAVFDAEVRQRQAQNALAVARARATAAGLTDSATLPVRSPLAGTVVRADVPVGRVVEPAEHLFEVVDLSTIWVRADVVERDLYRVAVGMAVEVRLTAYPGEVFRAAVTHVGPGFDPRTGLAAVWAELANPPGVEPRFLSGMSGEARLVLSGGPVPTVPAAAVVREGAERYVLVEEASAAGGSEYRRRAVTVGREADGVAEVRGGGLVPGDRVLARGSHALASLFAPTVLKLAAETERGIGLVVEPATVRAVDDVTELDGRVELSPAAQGTASASVAGVLSKLLVDRGQAVRAGDVVAEVVSLSAQATQAEYLRAVLDGRVTDETRQRVAAGGVATQRRLLDLEATTAANRQQQAGLREKLRLAGLTDAQLAELAATGKLVEAVPVRAPLGGVVAGFGRTVGQTVRAEEPLVTVADLAKPSIRVAVGERDLSRVHVGQRTRVRLTADPGFVAAGAVARSGRTVAEDARSLAVWVDLDAPPAGLLPGQLARVAVVASAGSLALAVPRSAVIAEGGDTFVFIRRPDGIYDRRAVRLGRADDRFVEVRDGLSAGDPVAVRGAAELNTAHAAVR